MKYDAEAVSSAKERGDEISEDGVEEAFDVRLPELIMFSVIYYYNLINTLYTHLSIITIYLSTGLRRGARVR